MLPLPLLLIAATAFTTTTTTASTTLGRRIAFQAHSYNDMRSWHQLFLKGATHLKIDPNFQDGKFCGSQARDHARDARGCFVLNHDNPTAFNKRLDYNTTSDLLALLADRTGPLRRFFTRPDVKVYVALCFKSIPANVCGHKRGAAENNWLGLVDDLVAAYLSLLAKDPDLNVEFVLDSGVPQACVVQRWRPLVSTGGDYPAAFTSNDASAGYDRWQVLNGKWPPGAKGQFATYASQRWGKFINSTRAFQVYEPCDQEQFLAAADVYVGAGVDHVPGLKFAINVDVAMSEVYLSTRTGRGMNRQLPDGSSKARLAAVSDAALVYTFLGAADGSTTMYGSSSGGGDVRPLPGWTQKVPPLSISVDEARLTMAAVTGGGVLQLYAYTMAEEESHDKNGLILSQLGRPVSLGMPAGAAHIAAAMVVAEKAEAGVRAIETEAVQLYVSGGGVFAQLWSVSVSADSNSTNASAAGAPLLLAQGRKAAARFVSGDVVAQRRSNGTLTIAAVYNDAGEADGTVLRLAMLDAAWTGHQRQNASASPDVRLRTAASGSIVGVGRSPSLSLRVLGDGTPYVAAAFADSFCPNNEKQNKQPRPASCAQTPTSYQGVLGYAQGPLSAWQSLVEAGESFSSCSDTLLHGAFSQGRSSGEQPSVAVLGSSGGVATVACVHGAYDGKDPHTCGAPEKWDGGGKGGDGGVVLDAWSFVVPGSG